MSHGSAPGGASGRMNVAESLYIVSRLRTRRLRQGVVPTLVELGGRVDGQDVLDIGCGPGECVACEIDDMGAASVTAIDIDPKMVRRARRRLADYGSRATVAHGDVTALDQADGSVDAVFNFAVLHHVPDWRAGLQEMARVLAPGGRLFSQDHDVANHDWISQQLFRHPPDRFTNAELLAEVEAVGLVPIGVEDRPEQLLVVALKPG
jgi:ubiquinone/menaquinone biosynthesis C-methylase UbiE